MAVSSLSSVLMSGLHLREIWSLDLDERIQTRVAENKVLRIIFELKIQRQNWKKFQIMSLRICIIYLIILL